MRCFENVNEGERNRIIKYFNTLQSYDEQNVYLAGLITVCKVATRRPRKEENEAEFHTASYKYTIRVKRNDTAVDIPICYKAMLALHGITSQRIQNIQKSLKATGTAPKDGRGRHKNRPQMLPKETTETIHAHINSFRGRHSHYSLNDSKRLYLPETLNIKKMHQMYIEKYQNKVSYETYRNIFNTKHNISFGYPRKDTCSSCDSYKVNKKSLEDRLAKLQAGRPNEDDTEDLDFAQDRSKDLKNLEREHELHLRKAQAFYSNKRKARLECRKTTKREAICMDFQKNLHVPNIATNDVYYRRQLSVYVFNIHILSTSESIFYTYTEMHGKKGADEVASMLWDFICNHLDDAVEELDIYCDSCCGQNKNYVIFRFLHYVVHFTKRLKKVCMTFPERGHSYLECDSNMALINQKAVVEIPSGWNDEIVKARVKPQPFKVVSCESQCKFLAWTTFLTSLYTKQCPFATRPIKLLVITEDHPRLIQYRPTYNGANETAAVLPSKKKQPTQDLQPGEFKLPPRLYEQLLPINAAKYKDLQILKNFCDENARLYFSSLPHTTQTRDD